MRGRWLNWRGSTGLQLATLVAVSWPITAGLQHLMSRATDQRAGLDEVDGASLISQAGFCRGGRPASRFMRRRRSQQTARTAFTRVPRQLGEATPEALPRTPGGSLSQF